MKGAKATNLEGKRFGRWLVISKAPSKNKRARWNCRCECGKEKIVLSRSLLKGQSTSCGCYSRELTKERNKSKILPNNEAAFRRIYRQYIDGARCYNREFNLTLEEVKLLVTGTCVYCGQEPNKDISGGGKRSFKGVPLMNGIDRVDNNAGYILENCVPCCKICNMMKKNLSKEDFLMQVNKITSYSGGVS